MSTLASKSPKTRQIVPEAIVAENGDLPETATTCRPNRQLVAVLGEFVASVDIVLLLTCLYSELNTHFIDLGISETLACVTVAV